MYDFLFGQNGSMPELTKPEWNPNELTITDMQKSALMRGMALAYEAMLQDLRMVKKPSQQTISTMHKIEQNLKQIRDEYE